MEGEQAMMDLFSFPLGPIKPKGIRKGLIQQQLSLEDKESLVQSRPCFFCGICLVRVSKGDHPIFPGPNCASEKSPVSSNWWLGLACGEPLKAVHVLVKGILGCGSV